MGKLRKKLTSSCTPIDPIELFRVLNECLSLDALDDPSKIVKIGFPDVSADNFRDQYLRKEVLRKYPGFNLGIDTRESALASFKEDEVLNAKTNERLRLNDVENPHVRQVFCLAARKAVTVLGRFRWDWFLEGVRFGPGATTRLKKEYASTVYKLSGTPCTTKSAYNLSLQLLSTMPNWYHRLSLESHEDAYVPSGHYSDLRSRDKLLLIRELDNLTTVPKNAVTDRTIGIGPDMNIFCQLGIGYHMRKRMFPWGINLNDQSINQRRAREGSVTGDTATLDIKSASNSVSWGLVWSLLGNHSHDARYFDPLWFTVLDALRTQGCLIDGISHEYELFSAMGNGFTFELESLIFWSLACATCEVLTLPSDVSVYGDDIILPVNAVPLFTEVLNHAGFRLNNEKSFSTSEGPLFRESCGSHFLDGRDVTPFYIDAGLDSPDQVLLLANNIVRWSKRPDGTLDGRMLKLWSFVVSHLPGEYLKLGIPYSKDANDGLILSFDRVRPSVCYLGSPEIKGSFRPPRHELFIGYRVNTLVVESREVSPDGQVGLTCWLYNAEKRRFQPPSHDRDFFTSIKRSPVNWVMPGCIPDSYGRACARGRYESPSPREITKLKFPMDARKRSFRLGSRVVRSWPPIGPWVVWTSESLLELGENFVT